MVHISARRLSKTMATVLLEGLGKLKKFTDLIEIEPAIFRLVE
jgi:hypothetical protein